MSKTDAGYVMTLTTTSGGQTSQMQISFMTIKIYAPTIQLNRRQHDVPASLTTEVHTKQRPGKIPATIEQSPASRLGPGAIAGIVIGAVGCLALLVIMITLLPANARKRRSAKDNSKHELDGTGAAARTELEASERHELDAEGENQIYELQDNSTLGGTTPKTDDADASAVSRYKRWSGRRLGW
ncbi:hypothetical protein HIM_03120 [Hirsutella minnesotensis 3608]|nr:hypothetical protein HIM_03120 [Hirsutella minnesotensis 3608]